MVDTLWQIFLGSLLVLAVALVWMVILAIAMASLKQARQNAAAVVAKLTVRNLGTTPSMLLEIRNVTTGATQPLNFELLPGNSKTIDLSV